MSLSVESHVSIERVAIIGGTHGNELIGVFQVRKFAQLPHLVQRSNFETLTLVSNAKAVEAGRRYIDTDLNRCFNPQDLQNPNLINYEQLLAKKIAHTIQQEKIDLIIDLHTTTSNMGLTIILHNQHPYLLGLAAYLTTLNPLVRVLVHQFNHDNSYLINLCKLGLAIEVGPIAQGTLHAELFQQLEALVGAILDFVERCNQGETPEIPKTLTLYEQVKILGYPRDEQQQIRAMIHPQLQARDYKLLHPGDPLFLGLDGEVILYQGESSITPVFINEAAYYEKDYALGLAIQQPMTLSD